MKTMYLLFLVSLCFSHFSFAQSCIPIGVDFKNQSEIDNFPTTYPGCIEMRGYVVVLENTSGNIRNLDGFAQVVRTGDGFSVVLNDSLRDLSAIEGLESVGTLQFDGNASLQQLPNLSLDSIKGTLVVKANPQLENLWGLDNINYVKKSVWIRNNDLLQNLEGLEQLEVIGDNFLITDEELLESLNGIENLQVIYGELRIENNASLNNLAGLGNINPFFLEHLIIEGNDSLAVCHEQVICDYLANGGTASISNNKSGCNSVQEVLDACGVVLSIEDLQRGPEVFIFPNPTAGHFQIHCEDNSIVEVSIKDANGKLLLQQVWQPIINVDLSKMSSGVYFITFQSDADLLTKRLVKY